MTHRKTRAQAYADTRSRGNLELSIHRLPNEIIARILITGCPLPDHQHKEIDTDPLSYQVLVTSICRLWKQIALHSPSLWTCVIVRPPPSMKSLSLYRKVLAAVLARSGTLELDISIKDVRRGDRPSRYYDLLSPHLSRAHTLDVEMGNFAVDIIPVSCIPELGKLRHFYVKGGRCNSSQLVFPPNARNAPLETFYYITSSPLCISSVPQAELQTLTLNLYNSADQTENLVKLMNNSRLQKLDLKVWTWETEATISSPTLIHLDIHMVHLRVSCLGQLPNLLHLHLAVSTAYPDRRPMTWPSLPSLRSLHVTTGRSYEPFLKIILQHAQQLVALQIGDEDAREVIDLFRERWDKKDYDLDGAARESLRLVRVVLKEPLSAERLGDLSELALILHAQRPHVQTEWYSLVDDVEVCLPAVIDRIEATPVSEEPSPPLFQCADEIIGASGG